MCSYKLYFVTVSVMHTLTLGFLETIPDGREIGNTSNVLYSIVNKIITSMINTKELEDNVDMKKLLSLYRDVKIKSHNYSKMFDDIRNFSKADFYDKIIYNVFNFNKMFNETFYNEYKNKINEQICGDVRVKPKYLNETKDELSRMIENFTCNFLYKINNLTLNSNNSNPFARRNLYNFNEKKKHPNLKIWAAPNMSNGFENMNTRRIFQGRKTSARKFPFIGSVHVSGEFVCGGSIIARCTVITAASCLENDEAIFQRPQNIFVRVGSDYANRGGKKYKVAAVYIHPEYDPTTLINNLAIIKLECDPGKEEKYSKKARIRRVEYDTLPEQIPINVDDITVLGWGAKHIDDDDESERLSYSHLNMYHIKDCQSLYTEKYVTLKHFCAGFISKGGGACNRDVGGPGVLDGVLMGVISFGSPVCGTPDAPTVFTKLGYYTNWIDTVLEQDLPIDGDEEIEKANQILALIQSYYKEDKKGLRKPVTTERTLRTKDKIEDDANIINTVMKMTSHIEVPKFIKDLYSGLPTKLIDLFAKNLDRRKVPKRAKDYIETSKIAVTDMDSMENLDLIFLSDTTVIPRVYRRITTTDTNQSPQHDHAKPMEEPSSSEIKASPGEISDNYESDSDSNDDLEIGMSIAQK